MSTDTTDIQDFHSFLNEECSQGPPRLTPEEAVAKFRALQRLKAELAVSLEEARRGEAKPLDVEEVIARGIKRAEAKGITE